MAKLSVAGFYHYGGDYKTLHSSMAKLSVPALLWKELPVPALHSSMAKLSVVDNGAYVYVSVLYIPVWLNYQPAKRSCLTMIRFSLHSSMAKLSDNQKNHYL